MIPLPTSKTTVTVDLNQMFILLYGPPKIGKSTFAASFPNTLFLATEPGHKFLEIFKTDVNSWQDMIDTANMLLSEKHDYKTLVIDTADNLFKFCEDYVCKEQGIEHPADLGWGKGWSFLRAEFQRVMLALANHGFGLVFISHQIEREIKGRVITYTKTTSTLAEGARKVIMPIVDIIALMSKELIKDPKTGAPIDDQRVLIMSGDYTIDAGSRGSSKAHFPEKVYLPSIRDAQGNIIDVVSGYECLVKAIKAVNK